MLAAALSDEYASMPYPIIVDSGAAESVLPTHWCPLQATERSGNQDQAGHEETVLDLAHTMGQRGDNKVQPRIRQEDGLAKASPRSVPEANSASRKEIGYLQFGTANIHAGKGEPKLFEGTWRGINAQTEEVCVLLEETNNSNCS